MEPTAASDLKTFRTHNSSEENHIISRLYEIKNALLKKGKITDEEIPSVKALLKDVIGYKDLAANIRNEFVNYITYEERSKDELIIKDGDSKVDMYIILKGKVKVSAFLPTEVHKELTEKNNYDIITQLNLFRSLKAGDIFGDLSCFVQEKGWKSIYAYSEDEKVELLKINGLKTKHLLDKVNALQKYLDLLLFLSDSIPGFKYRTTSHKERVAHCFHSKVYNAGHYLIKEGEKSDFAYIVKRGECRIISNQIPLIMSQKMKNKKTNKQIINTNGYFSKTTNSFQIGLISEKQWVGDEILIFKEDSFPFSVVTQSVVEVLYISKQELFTKMPKDIQSALEEKARTKLDWVKMRLIDICMDIENVAKWDNLQEDFKEKVNQVIRKFPKATQSALTSIMGQTPDNKIKRPLSGMKGFSQVLPNLDENIKQILNPHTRKEKQSDVSQSQQLFTNLEKAFKPSLTINLASNDYSRPKTAATSTNQQLSDSYYGGFFSTQMSFKKQIEDQNQKSIIASPLMVKDYYITQSRFMKRPNTQETTKILDFSSSQVLDRPGTAAANTSILKENQGVSFLGSNGMRRQRQQNISQSIISITSPINPINQSIRPGTATMNMSKMTSTTKHLAFDPSLKSLATIPLSAKSPNKFPMEMASTFVCSYEKKLSVPTFSKLQLAKKQNYEAIIKQKQHQFLQKHYQSEVLQKIADTADCNHTSFIINGKTITANKKLKRQDTPNFVEKWAKDHNVNLKEGGNPVVIKRKQQMMDTLLKDQKMEDKEKMLIKQLKRRMTISLKRITTLATKKVL